MGGYTPRLTLVVIPVLVASVLVVEKGNESSCDKAVFPTNRLHYSRVCGRVVAYQKGNTNAFLRRQTESVGLTVDSVYLDGYSITILHEVLGESQANRTNVWSSKSEFDKLLVTFFVSPSSTGCYIPPAAIVMQRSISVDPKACSTCVVKAQHYQTCTIQIA